MSPLDPELPPAGEEVHLPGPSIQPLLLAVAITIGVVGVVEGPVLWVPGLVLTLIVVFSWIRGARRELDELPLEHHH